MVCFNRRLCAIVCVIALFLTHALPVLAPLARLERTTFRSGVWLAKYTICTICDFQKCEISKLEDYI